MVVENHWGDFEDRMAWHQMVGRFGFRYRQLWVVSIHGGGIWLVRSVQGVVVVFVGSSHSDLCFTSVFSLVATLAVLGMILGAAYIFPLADCKKELVKGLDQSQFITILSASNLLARGWHYEYG